MSTRIQDLELYLVRNRDGQYFHWVGYGGYGKSWVDDPQQATVYQKLGSARSRVTWWARNYPDYGVPVIIKLGVRAVDELHETERFEKAQQKAEEAEVRREARKHQRNLREAEAGLKRARERLAAAKAKGGQ